MEIQFTQDCTGDLGIKVGDRVVAQYFVGHYSFHVHDIVMGGDPVNYERTHEALNAMLAIANREAGK
jgi:hypothetical protein